MSVVQKSDKHRKKGTKTEQKGKIEVEEASKIGASKQTFGDEKRSRTGGRMVLNKLQQSIRALDMCEMYIAPRVAEEAKKYKLKVGEFMDLTTGWDFSKAADRRKAEEYIEANKPLLVIGSPECTLFSSLQNLTPWTEEKRCRYTEARVHIAFCMNIYIYIYIYMSVRPRRGVYSYMNIRGMRPHGKCRR